MLRGSIFTIVYGVLLTPVAAADNNKPFLANLNNNQLIASTVPANGDLNPYGVAIVPRSVGALTANSVLVSNFNNSANLNNLQGTGTTIVQIGQNSKPTVFAQINASSVPGCVGGVGLTTALVALRNGWVIVGSLPTTDGSAATAKAGCLIVLNSHGQPVETFSGNGINGPWDMTAADFGNIAVLFVSNVLNGTVAAGGAPVNQGSVLRILLVMGDGASADPNALPHEIARTVIASGFGEKTDPAALVIGPTGLGLAADGSLYIADTLANRIAAIPGALFRLNNAGTGNTVSQGQALNAPLGLAIAPNGDILSVNAGDGNIVETTPGGSQVVVRNIDRTGAGGGTLFGLAIAPNGNGVYYVNDGDNTLNLLH
jgi:hypothetical protein